MREPTSTRGNGGDASTVVAARPSPSATVLRVIGATERQLHPLPSHGRVVIGRGKTSDIRVDDASISRQHLALTIDDGFRVEDLGSANGTRIGARTIAPGESLKVAAGELIELGSIAMVIEQATPAQSPRQVSGGATAIERLHALADRVARSSISVLILGETGAGKELLARRLHAHSPRSQAPFVGVNCAALSESLLESELFGYERGAFTGATQPKVGLIEAADGGTLFLDETGEMPQSLQSKLLRVLEQREVTRVGGVKPIAVDIRVISATNRALPDEVARGTFRRDLLFRLDGITLTLPPLRERLDELPSLAEAFARQTAEREQTRVPRISAAAAKRLAQHPWPGNVRELKNVIERAVVLANGSDIAVEHLGLPDIAPAALSPTDVAQGGGNATESSVARGLHADLDELERERILAVLDECAGNQSEAARRLGIGRSTLVSRLNAYGVPRPRKGR